jgi:hypothetical protein
VAIRRAIASWVMCIEHGHLMDEATAALLAEKGIWLSAQPFIQEMVEALPPGSSQRAKFDEVLAGMENTYRLAKKHKLRPGHLGEHYAGPSDGCHADVTGLATCRSGRRRRRIRRSRPFAPPGCAACRNLKPARGSGAQRRTPKRTPGPGKETGRHPFPSG